MSMRKTQARLRLWRFAIRDFEANYRVFSGVLKNAAVDVQVVPVSNIGLGNAFDDKLQLRRAPEPYNVLEPLRRAFPFYAPWWRRAFPRFSSAGRSDLEFRSQPANEKEPMMREVVGSGTAFISYRRDGGAEIARLICSELKSRGWHVFLDVDDLRSNHFDDRLLLEIQDSANFILILSPGSLDRCCDPKDWLKREIAHAMRSRKNVVPVLKSGFIFPPEESLPEDIRELQRHNGVDYSHVYFKSVIDKIESFMKRA